MSSIDTETQLCAVIGNPVGHSLSPLIHNAAFEAAELNCVYLAFQVEVLADFLAGMRAMPTFRGLSVTIPHKMDIIPLLDDVDAMAQKVGSVNTVTQERGRLFGTTTDGAGTVRAFEQAGVETHGKRVLFVGSGGAVRAVAFAMADLAGAAFVTIAGRTPERVAAIVSDLTAKTACPVEGIGLETLSAAMADHDIVIQGTPLGMYPHAVDQTPVPRELFRPGQTVFDMVYRPRQTRFLREASEAGCRTIPGHEMLLNQAALQFETWTGREAPLGAMRQAFVSRHGDKSDA